MRQVSAIRLLYGTALAALISLGAFAAGAQDADPRPPEAAEAFDPDSVTSFAGAILAAGNADIEKDYETAAALYKKALSIEPGHLEIRERLMFTLLMSGAFDEGAALAEELKGDEAFQRVTAIVRAAAAIKRQDYAQAEAILKYDGPNDLDRLTNTLLTAWTQAGAGKGQEAIALLDKLRGPSWFGLFRNYHAGAIAIVAGDEAKARKFLNAAVTDREGAGTAPDTFMRAVMALARLEAAAGNRQKALDSISAGETLISNYAPLKALRESIDRGEKPPQQVTDAAAGAGAVLFSVGGALNRPGAEDIVGLYLQISHALDPESADTLLLLGGVAENLEQPQRAIAFYRKVPESSPMRRISELQLGLALAQTGEVEEARAHLKSLIDADPTDLRSYLSYGSVLSEAKDYAAMAENYDRAVEAIGKTSQPSHWSIYFQRGIAYERLKQWDKAEPNFLKALELNPDQPQVLNYLGYSWVDMDRNLEQGLDMIRKAVELRPDDGYIVDSLGWAYYRLGRFEEAATELERAVELRAGDAVINDHLGDAYWRVGRQLEAGFQWRRALTLNPELPEIPKIEAKIRDGLPDLPPVEMAGAGSQAAAAGSSAAPDASSYTVKAGDSLWKIAVETLGDGHRFTDIIKANPALQRRPDQLAPGQVLTIPGN